MALPPAHYDVQKPESPPMKPLQTPLMQHQIHTELGDVLLAASAQGLAGVWFIGQQHWPNTSGWVDAPHHPMLQKAQEQLHAYFSGQRMVFDMPLAPAWGTPFQRAVWQALQTIGYGRTVTYGDVAQTMGNLKAVRAVGAAIGRNPLSVIVPCHRVVGSNGSLTGYAGGLDRKKALLHLEAAHA